MTSDAACELSKDVASFRDTSDGNLPTDEEEEEEEEEKEEDDDVPLQGAVDDILVPDALQIDNTYWDAFSLWQTYLTHAKGDGVKLDSLNLL